MPFQHLKHLGKERTKDLIIIILGYYYPLSARKIHYILRRYGSDISYQGVHKTLKLLISNQVIVRNGRNYSLNQKWIEKIHSFSELLKARYANDELANIIKHVSAEKNDMIQLNLNSLLELDKLTLKIHNFIYPRLKKGKIVCMHYRHQWWHLIYPMKKYSDKNKNKRFYMLCAGKTLLDKQGVDLKRRLGFNVAYADCAHDRATNVYEDYVMEIFYDPELWNLLHSAFRKVKRIDELDVPKLIRNVFERKSRIVVLIYKNRFVADLLRKITLSYFSNL